MKANSCVLFFRCLVACLFLAASALLSACGTLQGSVQKSAGSPANFGLSTNIPLGR